MKLIHGINNINKYFHGCVLTIGNFDGVHRGHQALLQKLCTEGKIRGLLVVVMIFEPQPLELLAGKNAPARLTQLRDKICYLTQQGVDYVFCIRFNHYFASLSAKKFVSNLLVKQLGVQFLIVGDDFRFGANRQGDFYLLKRAGLKYGFDVTSTITLYEGNIRISSTAIRQALANNQLDVAERLLGHKFSISGRVIHGDKLGRTIGFPTANILLRSKVLPVTGVYAVKVLGLGNKPLLGIANIGTRPTVFGVRQLLEVHLLDITIDLYGQYINVILCKKIRSEQKFASLNELKAQIVRDRLKAYDFF